MAVSRDTPFSQAKFAESVGAQQVTFLADRDGDVIERYGTLNPGSKLAQRNYFLIDESGTLIWKNVTGQLIPSETLISDLTALIEDN